MIFRARGLARRFEGGETLTFPDLDVPEGSRFGVVGRNGSGKTTLLELLAGLAPRAEGTLELCGRAMDLPLAAEQRSLIGYVAQQPFPLPGAAEANVVLAVQTGGTRTERRHEAHAWLERFGIGALADKSERKLSIGQLRRVALARAFARQPRVLVLDEPFAFGDPAYRQTLSELLEQHHEAGGTTVVTSPQPGELDGWATHGIELG